MVEISDYMKLEGSKGVVIKNPLLCGLKRTMSRSGFPMTLGVPEPSEKRLLKLGKAPQGSGHDCALKGLYLRFDLTLSQSAWMQWERYSFSDIVSSQSKMHRIHSIDIDEQCNEYVLPQTKDIVRRNIEIYNESKAKVDFLTLVYNIPMGLLLTADIETNALQEKTVYNQRKNHKLPEWNEYAEWLLTVPYLGEVLREQK